MKRVLFGILFLVGLSAAAPSLAARQSGAAPLSGALLATATFAGGCFWCMEPPFEGQDGVVSVTAGYTGGQTKNPVTKRFRRRDRTCRSSTDRLRSGQDQL